MNRNLYIDAKVSPNMITESGIAIIPAEKRLNSKLSVKRNQIVECYNDIYYLN
jgi:hypothetical protein